MFALAWDIKEMENLNSKGRMLLVNIGIIFDKLREPPGNWGGYNIPLKITNVRDEATQFVKGVTRCKRTAATHCLVVMIGTEERNKKPYALPVQCMPYKGLKDNEVRKICNQVIQEMYKRNMNVAGNHYTLLYPYYILL